MSTARGGGCPPRPHPDPCRTDPRLVILQMSVSPASLARLYEEDFKQDMAALKVGGW